jgi:hypothetical protein
MYKSCLYLSFYRFIINTLHYPNDIDKSLNETVTDKIRKYKSDYNSNPPVAVAFMPSIAIRLGRYIVNLCDFILTGSSGN